MGISGENPASIPKSGLEIKNHCTQGANLGQSLQRLPSLTHEIKNHCSPGVVAVCRRNHSSMQRRRLESDAEDRCNHGRCRRNPSSLPQQKLESAQISAKFLNTFRANHSKIHKYLQYSQNLTGGRNALENQSEILILLQFIGKHL